MRTRIIRAAVYSCLCLVVAVAASAASAQEAAKLDGKWKLVLLPFGEDEFLIVDVKTQDGKPAASVVHAASYLPSAAVKSLEQQGNQTTLTVSAGTVQNVFTGKLVTEGKDAGRILGTFNFRGAVYPARLERTDADKLAAATLARALSQKIQALRSDPDAKSKVAKLEAMLKEHSGGGLSVAYSTLLGLAEEAQLTDQQVRGHLKDWIDDAQRYGDKVASDARSAAVRALTGKKAFASLTLELAQEAEKAAANAVPALQAQAATAVATAARLAGKTELAAASEKRAAELNLKSAEQAEKALSPTSTPEQQETAVRNLAAAARKAGKLDLAKATEERLAKLEATLDEKYHSEVPPFKPESFAGRAKPDQDRVVLFELFTGAQCPPCVAADVAFDALIKSYKPTELVTLQYHLHIPGPDALTNRDTVARAAYYGANSTPSTYFNGSSQAAGGGAMANAKTKYDQYRKVIDPALENARQATINLTATRSGDRILVSANAQSKDASDKLRLRLALTEESIKYVGGNRLRFHHHVVRDMPGGVEGKELVAGQCQVDLTIELAEVRTEIDQYLTEFAQQRAFPGSMPQIDFKGLSLVAFVQNDADKSILHAVATPVPEAK